MRAIVLLLERRDEVRAALAAALENAGFTVVSVNAPERVLEYLEVALPEVVLAGLHPSARDADLNLCRQIRAHSRTKDIPLILTTEQLTDEDVGLATDPGALVLAATPHDATKVAAAIHGVLTAKRAKPIRASLRHKKHTKRSA